MGYHIFFLSPSALFFIRYDTLLQKWKQLPTLPIRGRLSVEGSGSIVGFAVLSDTILINFEGCNTRAYSVSRDAWYAVKDVGKLCSNIVGEAVVQNDIIYTLRKRHLESLDAFILNCQVKEGDDLEFTCGLKGDYVVAGMREMMFDSRGGGWPYRHLVRLGEDNFCVVQTCDLPLTTIQNIQLTYVGVRETKWIVTNICHHKFDIPINEYMWIQHCFSLPPELEAEFVTLPPELCLDDEYSEQTNTITEEAFKQGGSFSTQSCQISDHADITDEEGHSICVINLPPDFSLVKFKMELKKFGPIKDINIYPDYSWRHMGECWIADVEFESATSKQNAIKASRITFGASIALILEKRRTGFSLNMTLTRGEFLW